MRVGRYQIFEFLILGRGVPFSDIRVYSLIMYGIHDYWAYIVCKRKRGALKCLVSYYVYSCYLNSQYNKIIGLEFDLQKAFDQVNNDSLLAKTCAIGYPPGFLRLFADYLHGSKQIVRLGIYKSQPQMWAFWSQSRINPETASILDIDQRLSFSRLVIHHARTFIICLIFQI